jgi:hypothetical protein
MIGPSEYTSEALEKLRQAREEQDTEAADKLLHEALVLATVAVAEELRLTRVLA